MPRYVSPLYRDQVRFMLDYRAKPYNKEKFYAALKVDFKEWD